MMATMMATALAVMCARPDKSKGIFLNALGSIIANFISFGMLPVNIFYSVHELPKKLKMRVLIRLGLPSSSFSGFYQSILHCVSSLFSMEPSRLSLSPQTGPHSPI